MKTLASELQRLRDLASPYNSVLLDLPTIEHKFEKVCALASDMMRLIEHQARLLEAARIAVESTPDQPDYNDSYDALMERLITARALLDPNQPMSEE